MQSQKPNTCSKCSKEFCLNLTKGMCQKCYKHTIKKVCSKAGCKYVAGTAGLCKLHHREAVQEGKLDLMPKGTIINCHAENCERKIYGHNLCRKHYLIEYKKRFNPNYKPKVNDQIESKKDMSVYFSKTVDGVVKYTISADRLAYFANVTTTRLTSLLNNLKEDGQIIDFNYDKKLKIVNVAISLENEIKFNNTWNSSAELIEEKGIDEGL